MAGAPPRSLDDSRQAPRRPYGIAGIGFTFPPQMNAVTRGGRGGVNPPRITMPGTGFDEPGLAFPSMTPPPDVAGTLPVPAPTRLFGRAFLTGGTHRALNGHALYLFVE